MPNARLTWTNASGVVRPPPIGPDYTYLQTSSKEYTDFLRRRKIEKRRSNSSSVQKRNRNA